MHGTTHTHPISLLQIASSVTEALSTKHQSPNSQNREESSNKHRTSSRTHNHTISYELQAETQPTKLTVDHHGTAHETRERETHTRDQGAGQNTNKSFDSCDATKAGQRREACCSRERSKVLLTEETVCELRTQHKRSK